MPIYAGYLHDMCQLRMYVPCAIARIMWYMSYIMRPESCQVHHIGLCPSTRGKKDDLHSTFLGKCALSSRRVWWVIWASRLALEVCHRSIYVWANIRIGYAKQVSFATSTSIDEFAGISCLLILFEPSISVFGPIDQPSICTITSHNIPHVCGNQGNI